MSGDSGEVLIVDSEDRDVVLLRKAIEESRFADLHVIGDAQRAIAYLHHDGEFARAATPQLIVIDASRSERHGFDVLLDVMQDRRLHHIPVIVLVEGEQEFVPTFLGGHWSIVKRPLEHEAVDTLLESLALEILGPA